MYFHLQTAESLHYLVAARLTGREEIWRNIAATTLPESHEDHHREGMIMNAVLGDMPAAVEHFRQIDLSFNMADFDLPDDRFQIFNGLTQNPEFHQAWQERQQHYQQTLTRLRTDFPEMFTP